MTVEKLQQDPSYFLLLVLRHEDLLPFLQEEVFGKTKTMRFFWAVNLLLLVGLLVFAWMDTQNGAIGWGSLLTNLGLGSLLVLTILIPVHEAVHGLAYKMVGAPKVSYGANWKMFYFYAVADQFVVNKKAFMFIGLAPFAVFTMALFGALFFVPIETRWLLAGIIFLHTSACVGDFAMVGFYERHRNFEEILTFDDVKAGITYFYAKECGDW